MCDPKRHRVFKMVATEKRPSLRIKSYAQLVNTYMKEREREKKDTARSRGRQTERNK